MEEKRYVWVVQVAFSGDIQGVFSNAPAAQVFADDLTEKTGWDMEVHHWEVRDKP